MALIQLAEMSQSYITLISQYMPYRYMPYRYSKRFPLSRRRNGVWSLYSLLASKLATLLLPKHSVCNNSLYNLELEQKLD